MNYKPWIKKGNKLKKEQGNEYLSEKNRCSDGNWRRCNNR